MEEILQQKVTYNFRLNRSSTIISLNEEQVQSSQYSDQLVSMHSNDKDPLILSNFIRYHAFTSIFASITAKRTSFLFSKLPKNCNSMYMIRLYEYLRIDPSFIDLNAYKNIDFNQKFTPTQAQDFAVEIIIGYSIGLRHQHATTTNESIVHLIERILSEPSIFSSRLRYHSFIVANSILDSEQMTRLQSYHSIIDTAYDDDDNDDMSEKEKDKSLIHSLPEQIFLKKNIVSSANMENTGLSTRANVTVNPMIPFLYLSIIGTLQDQNRYVKSEAKSTRAGHFKTMTRQTISYRCKHRVTMKKKRY